MDCGGPHLTRVVRDWCKLYGMAQIPTPLRAALGLVANAIEGARTLPDKAVELPVLAVSTALQFSLRAQQRYAEFTLRGDEVLSRMRGLPEEPPSWATFDDEPAEDAVNEAAEEGAAGDAAQAVPIEHPDPNARAGRRTKAGGPAPAKGPVKGPAEGPVKGPAKSPVKSAAKQPRARKAATAKKDRAGKTTAKRAATKTTGRGPKPSAFDEAAGASPEHEPSAD